MFCSKCGTELSSGFKVCPKCGTHLHKRSYLKLSLLILLGLIFLITAGYFGNQQIKISTLNRKLEEAIGKDAGYTETILKVEEEASSISYEELFNLCDKSIEFRTNLIVDLRGLYPGIESELRDNLIDFLNDENELIRQKNHFYHKKLSYNTILKIKDELHREVQYFIDVDSQKPRSYELRTFEIKAEYYLKRINELNTEFIEAVSEMAKSADEFISTYNLLADKESALKRLMESKGLRFIGFIEKYHKENLMLVDEIKEQAKSINL